MKAKYLLLSIGATFCINLEASDTYWKGDLNKAIANTLIERNVSACQQMKWRVSEKASYKFTVLCSADGANWAQYEVVPSMKQVKGPDKKAVDPHPEETATVSWAEMKASYDKQIEEEKLASRSVSKKAAPSDMAQANKFLSELPPACAGSYKDVDSNGEVNVYVRCNGNGQKMNGLFAIKNGAVTKIQ